MICLVDKREIGGLANHLCRLLVHATMFTALTIKDLPAPIRSYTVCLTVAMKVRLFGKG